ncbi:MAG: peptidoglycan DD-metalloendopeptidase family protein [Oscillospiraceae bacterium]|nr:peptidoglycan DD-metalloendopeptidase family protein [Oscillospiraceae bacterium]
MKRKKLWVSLLAGLLALLMIFGIIAGILPTYASAEKSSAELKQELNQMQQELKKKQQEVNKIQGQISANKNNMKDVVEQKNLTDQKIFLLHQQVQNISQQITAYNTLIADKQEELDAATARWQELNEKYKERIRAMEENGKVSYWSVLFKANNFSDFLDRLNMIEEIAAADQRRLEELNDAANLVQQAKDDLAAEKTALETSKQELEASSAELEESQKESDKLLKDLIAVEEEYQKLLAVAEQQKVEAASTVDQLEYAYDAAKEREYREWLASQPTSGGAGSNTVDGITWLMPINYTYFSSPFGYRIHPIYGDRRFHYGVDLSAPQGTPIYASRGGVVTTTAYEAGGAGYYVSINHLDGFSTRYLHMTHYIVSPGQYVAAGQVIGYCGSTGGSTGPHLHFGVYYNGTAVNPAKYINIT